MRKASWDQELARRLMEEGEDGRKLSDLEIAERVGANLSVLRAWKSKNGLTKPRKAVAVNEEKPAEAAPTVAIKKETPERTVLGPVEVAFAVGNIEAKVAAPDVEQAVNAAKHLLKLAEDLRLCCYAAER